MRNANCLFMHKSERRRKYKIPNNRTAHTRTGHTVCVCVNMRRWFAHNLIRLLVATQQINNRTQEFACEQRHRHRQRGRERRERGEKPKIVRVCCLHEIQFLANWLSRRRLGQFHLDKRKIPTQLENENSWIDGARVLLLFFIFIIINFIKTKNNKRKKKYEVSGFTKECASQSAFIVRSFHIFFFPSSPRSSHSFFVWHRRRQPQQSQSAYRWYLGRVFCLISTHAKQRKHK